MERADIAAGIRSSVTEIGLAIGFRETSSFTTAFRKATGQTPTAYRRTLADIPHGKQNVMAFLWISFGGINLMQLPELTNSTVLRWTSLVAAAFAAFIVALLGFVYLTTKDDLTMRSDPFDRFANRCIRGLVAGTQAGRDQRASEAGSGSGADRRIV